jgi:hypothetical protein
MGDGWFGDCESLQARYRVELLEGARVEERGVVHLRAGSEFLIPWSHVRRALAAEVGEPEGVRTIVFDLALGVDVDACHVVRFDAEPGEEAMRIARQIGDALGPDRATPSLKSVATDGVASRWYPDLASFEVEALRVVTF